MSNGSRTDPHMIPPHPHTLKTMLSFVLHRKFLLTFLSKN